MKRSWMGAGLLVVLLIAGLLVTHLMAKIHDPVARDLKAAGEYALTGNWEQAEAHSRKALQTWEKNELLRACFADHGPMEEMDACFAQLKVYLRMKEETAFAAACAETARKAEAMGEAHGLVWENIF